MTQKRNIEHIEANSLVLPDKDATVALVDHDLHIHVAYKTFLSGTENISSEESRGVFCATAQIGENNTVRPWSEIKQVIGRVHKHDCGHSTYSYVKILLERN